MSANETTHAVKAMYERFPYPNHGFVGSLVSRMARASVEDLRRERGRRLRIVDVGCGTGEQTVGLAQRFPDDEVVGVDVSERSVDIARELALKEGVNATFHRADIHTELEALGTFDLVVCIGVLHHLPDPRAGMEALRKVAGPGGRLLGMVYGRKGRRRIRALQEVLRLLDPESEGDERVSMIGDIERWVLVRDRVDRAARRLRHGPSVDPVEAAKRVLKGRHSDEYLVDMYAHVQECDYTWPILEAELSSAGWQVLGWPERSGMPDQATDVLTPTGAAAAEALPLSKRAALFELLTEPDKLYFVAEAGDPRDATASEGSPEDIRAGVTELYEEYPYPNHGVIGSVVARMLRRPIETHPKRSGLRLLDAGCGTGEQTLGVAKTFAGTEVVGIDYNERSVERAQHFSREHGIEARFERGDLMQPLDHLGSFDVIVSIGVLHTLPDSDAGFRHLRGIASPDCVFLGMVYGVFGRYDYVRVREVLQRLCGPGASREERLDTLGREKLAGNAGPAHYADALHQRLRFGPKIGPLEAARRVVAGRSAAYQADAYDHVKDDGHTWQSIYDMLHRTGWELTGWPDDAGFPRDPSALFSGRALDRARSLSTLALGGVYERLLEPGNLYFLARPRADYEV